MSQSRCPSSSATPQKPPPILHVFLSLAHGSEHGLQSRDIGVDGRRATGLGTRDDDFVMIEQSARVAAVF